MTQPLTTPVHQQHLSPPQSLQSSERLVQSQSGKTDKQTRQTGLSVDLASLISCKGAEEPELEVTDTGQAGLDMQWTGKVSMDFVV